MMRLAPILAACLVLAACADPTRDLSDPVEPLGDFRLGFSEVVAPRTRKLLVSRDVTPEEWVAAVDEAVETRFGRFEGTRFYHLGISVEGYSVPPPVVPGESFLGLRVTVWDDARQEKMNAEPRLILNAQVFESRILNSREDTIALLAQTSARLIEDWLRDQQAEEGWFVSAAPEDAAADAADVAPEDMPNDTVASADTSPR